MGISILVHCNCWERGLCKPCSIDMSLLDPPNAEHDWLTVKGDLPLPQAQAVNQRFYEWREAACEHPGGVAFFGRLGSYSFASGFEKDVAHLTTRDDDVLVDILNDLNLANAATTEWQDSELILEDLDRLKTPDSADPFWSGINISAVERALKDIRDAATTSVTMRKKILWG